MFGCWKVKETLLIAMKLSVIEIIYIVSFLGPPSNSQLTELKISNNNPEIQETTPQQHFQTDEELAFTNSGSGQVQSVPVTSPHPLMSLLSQVQQVNSGGPGGAIQPPAAVLFNPGTEAALQTGGDEQTPEGIKYPKLAVHKVSMNKDQADQLMSFLAQSEGNVIDVELLEHHFPWLRLDNGQLPRYISQIDKKTLILHNLFQLYN